MADKQFAVVITPNMVHNGLEALFGHVLLPSATTAAAIYAVVYSQAPVRAERLCSSCRSGYVWSEQPL